MSRTFDSFWNYDERQTSETDFIPETSFQSYDEVAESTLDSELATVFIISDANEVNENFSIVIKCILDNIYMNDDEELVESQRTYHNISQYALKLLTSNLFTKNFQFCIGKILSLLQAFTQITEHKADTTVEDKISYQGECLKEFLCITLLLLLKLQNSNSAILQEKSDMSKTQVYEALRKFEFVKIMSSFISAHIIASENRKTPFVLIKFSCDIIFEYLYHREVLCDSELKDLKATNLISTIAGHILSEDICSSYEVDNDTFDDERKLVIYELFKLLLLINEQFLMKAYTCGEENEVFKHLTVDEDGNSNNSRLVRYINLSIYHLNREESQIIKILILKFLYLVFTKENTKKLVYLNDLKILVDIVIRELNNLEYNLVDDTRILVIDYLRVMYPMLINSQLPDIYWYKNDEILKVLGSLASSIDSNSSFDENKREQEDVISKLAIKCMKVPWLKSKKSSSSLQLTRTNSSNGSSTDISDIGAAFTRIASVRTSTRADYHRQTTSHNLKLDNKGDSQLQSNIFRENNNNVFLRGVESLSINDESSHCLSKLPEQPLGKNRNILDLPTEYMNSKPLPELPDIPLPERKRNGLYSHNGSSTSSINSLSLLVQKSMKKQAPPPPPVAPYSTSSPSASANCTPPPPPPPRRRRL